MCTEGKTIIIPVADDDRAKEIHALLPSLTAEGVEFRIFELHHEERPSSKEEWMRAEVSERLIYNLLESHEESVEQIKHIDSLRYGDEEDQ